MFWWTKGSTSTLTLSSLIVVHYEFKVVECRMSKLERGGGGAYCPSFCQRNPRFILNCCPPPPILFCRFSCPDTSRRIQSLVFYQSHNSHIVVRYSDFHILSITFRERKTTSNSQVVHKKPCVFTINSISK